MWQIEIVFNFKSWGLMTMVMQRGGCGRGTLQRGLLLGAALCATAPWAVTAAHAAVSRPKTTSGIETVVVTAEKRAEPILSVAGSVTAVTASELQQTHSVSLADYAAMAPGLDLISQRQGQTQLILRGITTGPSTPNATVAIYEDDTPYGSSTAFAAGNQLTLDLDPSDLERVEVLRGPQGTLYGASSIGGVVKYVTTPPDLENYRGRLEVDGKTVSGGGEGYGLRAMANIPLSTDTLGFRVSGFDRFDPGYIDDPALGRKNLNSTRVYGGRAQVLWQPNDRLRVRLNVQYQRLRSGGMSEEDVDGITLQPLYGDLIQRRYSNEPLNVRYLISSAVVDYDFGWATLMSATSYSTLRESQLNDLTTTYGPVLQSILHFPIGVSFDIPIDESKMTEEVRLTSPSNQTLEWQLGFFFTHERSTHTEVFNPFDPTTGAAIPINLLSGALNDRYTEYAVYGDVDYHFTSKFDLLAGLRYGTNRQNYSQPESGALIGPTTTLYAKSSDDSITFLVSPRYRFDSNNMIYARIASGYRPGGPNALTPAEVAGGVPSSFGPDTLVNYEVGYKAALLDHKLALGVSVFYIDWRDVQIQTMFGGFDATGNGGSAKSQGVELSATYVPVDGLTLSGNLDYTDATLTANATGINAKSGDRLPNVPRFAAYLSADYTFELLPDWDASVGGALRYTDSRESSFVTGTPSSFSRPVMPSYTTFGLHAGVTHDGWKLSVYAKNLNDSRGITSLRSLAFDSYSNPYAAAIIQPRTVGISLSVEN